MQAAVRHSRVGGGLLLLITTLWLGACASGSVPPPEPQPLPGVTQECIEEPVFNGKVCVYQANPTATRSIVLIHGINGRALVDWRAQIPVLARHYHVIALDLPGFGDSSKGNQLYSPDNYARVVHFVVQRFASRPFDLVGHSMGGGVAIRYAAQYPEDVRRLVLVDVSGILQRVAYSKYLAGAWADHQGLTASPSDNFVSRFVGKVMSIFHINTEQIIQSRDNREETLHGDPTAIAGIALLDHDFAPELRRLHAPTLLIWGGEDHLAPLRTAEVLRYRIPGARLEVLADSGHVPMRRQGVACNPQLRKSLLSPLPAASEPPAPYRDIHHSASRIGRCDGQSGVSFEGAYARIELRNCADVTLRHVTTGAIVAYESRGRITDSEVQSDGIALDATGSDLEITASRLRGTVAIHAARSRLDIAGSTLVGSQAAVTGGPPSRLIFSVSDLHSPHTQGDLHKVCEVDAGHPL